MKKVTVPLIMLMLVQVLVMAQYTGGNGRGDFMLGFSPCSNPASGGEIEAGQTICEGTTPAEITNKTSPAGYTGSSNTNGNTPQPAQLQGLMILIRFQQAQATHPAP